MCQEEMLFLWALHGFELESTTDMLPKSLNALYSALLTTVVMSASDLGTREIFAQWAGMGRVWRKWY
jgi:hypothetical protein